VSYGPLGPAREQENESRARPWGGGSIHTWHRSRVGEGARSPASPPRQYRCSQALQPSPHRRPYVGITAYECCSRVSLAPHRRNLVQPAERRHHISLQGDVVVHVGGGGRVVLDAEACQPCPRCRPPQPRRRAPRIVTSCAIRRGRASMTATDPYG
jgi:hypothetical protein